jgi:hypothetical protein
MFDNMYNEKHIKYKIDFFFEIKDLFLNLPNFLNNNYISIL